jgi:hypothetical protein
VRKAIRAPEGAFDYQRTVQPLPRLGPFQERLDALLAENEARHRRDRLRMTRIHDLLVREGFEGSYDAVRRYARRWTEARRKDAGDGARVHPADMFKPGEAYQFDWSHEDVEIAGKPMRVKVAHMRLCASRAVYVRAYPRETQEMVFDAHARAFAFFGGACTRGIYDNLWTPPGQGSSGVALGLDCVNLSGLWSGAVTLLALMGVRYLLPHNMIGLCGLVVDQDSKRRPVPLHHQRHERLVETCSSNNALQPD